MWKTTKIVSGVLGIAFWNLSVFVWMYFDSHRPKIYMAEDGRIFPLNSHGSIVYLTAGEHYFLYGLMAAGIGFFLLCVICYFIDGGKFA
jgi:hypothetical protein